MSPEPLPPPPPTRGQRLIGAAVALAAIVVVGRWMADAVVTAGTWPANDTSDALPLYLVAHTVLAGGDPTDKAALAATYAAHGIRADHAVLSTLYPSSAAALLAPFVPTGWPRFAMAWHGVLLWSAVVAGAAGAASGAGRRWAWVAAPLGAALATAGFPIALECARLGQINQLLAAGGGLAQLAVVAGGAWLAAVLLVLGGGLKLVPMLAMWPFFTGRRWREVAVGTATGVAVLALTACYVPLGRAVAGVVHTLAYEGATQGVSAGLDHTAPEWMLQVLGLRHLPLAVLTVAVAAIAGARARPASIAGGIALVFAWLAADSAAQHELYLPLALGAITWVAAWPLSVGAPGWSVVPAGVVTAVVLALPWVDGPPAFEAVVAGEIAWAGVAIRALTEAAPLSRRVLGALAAAAVLAGALMPHMMRLPPPGTAIAPGAPTTGPPPLGGVPPGGGPPPGGAPPLPDAPPPGVVPTPR